MAALALLAITAPGCGARCNEACLRSIELCAGVCSTSALSAAAVDYCRDNPDYAGCPD